MGTVKIKVEEERGWMGKVYLPGVEYEVDEEIAKAIAPPKPPSVAVLPPESQQPDVSADVPAPATPTDEAKGTRRK